jgi:redox-sensitive bicupin YhaK (pirin superfamily)
MPAVTVNDLSTLPRVTSPADASSRPVVSVTPAPSGFEGNGFPVRRAFAGVTTEQLDPFVHMDQMGEIDYAPGAPKGTPWHPHRGFETVTYLIDGVFRHQDSHGGGGMIRDGDTQWMTAGSGILHIEEPPEDLVASGGLFHGIQLWVNLPAARKMSAPRYQAIEASDVLLLADSDAGALLRVIAGDIDGHVGPGNTHTPISLIHASLEPGSTITLPWPTGFNALAYGLAGSGTAGEQRAEFGMGQLVTFGSGDSVTITAAEHQDTRTGDFEVLLLGGAPIGEPVAWQGPFVMNTQEELRQAFDDFQKGLFGPIPDQA